MSRVEYDKCDICGKELKLIDGYYKIKGAKGHRYHKSVLDLISDTFKKERVDICDSCWFRILAEVDKENC